MDAQQLQHLIAAALPCEHLEVDGDGRHWYATLVSTAFEGLTRIKRHQMVLDKRDMRLIGLRRKGRVVNCRIAAEFRSRHFWRV